MLLAIDIGNTEITLGLFSGDNLVLQWRMATHAVRTPDEWGGALRLHLDQVGRPISEVKAAIVASVVPKVTQPLVDGVASAAGVDVVLVGPKSKLPIVLDVDEPMTVGPDRIMTTLAACSLYGRDTIVVDFGTATTFDCITADGRFIGGVIAPGIETAAAELARRAAKLPATELTPPDRVIGRRTEDCVRAGVMFGNAELTDGIIRRIKSEWPSDSIPFVVATGGLAQRLAALSDQIEEVNPSLTLVGLQLAAGHLGLEW